MIKRIACSTPHGRSRIRKSGRIGLTIFLVILGLAILPGGAPARAESVTFPMQIDFQQLRALFIHTAYTGPNQSIQLADAATDCRYIQLSDPHFSSRNGLLWLETHVYIHVAVEVRGYCLRPVTWSGWLVTQKTPHITPDWRLGFNIADSQLVGEDRQPAAVAGVLWNLVKSLAHRYLEDVRINLAPPVANLKTFLEPLFDEAFSQQSLRMLDTMHPGAITVAADGLRLTIMAEVDDLLEEDQEPEYLTDRELDQFIDTWEAWDAFLIHIITELAGKQLSDMDREILFGALLDTRYAFIHELVAGTLTHDFVRQQFITVWHELGPVFRRHLSGDVTGNTLGYLSFFTASDALTALDRIGPSLGIEISHNGLIRLARFLSGEELGELVYHDQVNLLLRQILGLGPPPRTGSDLFIPPQLDFEIIGDDSNDDHSSVWQTFEQALSFGRFMIPGLGMRTAHAQTTPAVEMARLRQWVVTRENFSEYMGRVTEILHQEATATLQKSKMAPQYHDLYHDIILATAWQESCFRQFHIRRSELTYIRSYNNTSVGIMQINEKVWRGLYDIEHLRWDIHYNAKAGCEIAHEYLTRYAFRRMDPDKPLEPKTIAQLLYAMYNGGPSQHNRFLARHQKGDLFLSDRLFLEKYEWTVSDELDMVRRCLFGG